MQKPLKLERNVLQRVSVVGTSASGKTTFARQLAMILNTRFTELDALHWGPNWSVRPTFRQDVAAVAEHSTWVIDGSYGSKARDLVWSRCTAIIWLDFGFWTTFGRGVRRTLKRVVTRERLYADNRESWRTALFDPQGIPQWIVRTYWRRRRELPVIAARPEYAHATFIALRSPAEAARFLRLLEPHAASDTSAPSGCSASRSTRSP